MACAGDGVYPPPGEAGQTLVDAGIDRGRWWARGGATLRLTPMLPEVLVPAEGARHRRSRRDWFVDSVFFLLALLIGALVLGNVDQHEDLLGGR